MMKKLVMILMCIVLIFTVAACGADTAPSASQGESETQVENTNTETDAGAAGQASDEKGVAEEPAEKELISTGPAEVTEEEPEETESIETVEAKNLGFGVIEGNVYTNKYVGIGAEFDGNWQLLDIEALTGTDELVQQALEGSAYDDLTGGNWPAQIFDFQAMDLTTGNNINLVYTKLENGAEAYREMYTEEFVIGSIMQNKDTLVSTYASSGITVESMEIVTVTFLGEEHLAIYTVATTSGVPMYMVQLADYQLGVYGATLTVTSFYEDITQDLLAMFYVVE